MPQSHPLGFVLTHKIHKIHVITSCVLSLSVNQLFKQLTFIHVCSECCYGFIPVVSLNNINLFCFFFIYLRRFREPLGQQLHIPNFNAKVCCYDLSLKSNAKTQVIFFPLNKTSRQTSQHMNLE